VDNTRDYARVSPVALSIVGDTTETYHDSRRTVGTYGNATSKLTATPTAIIARLTLKN